MHVIYFEYLSGYRGTVVLFPVTVDAGTIENTGLAFRGMRPVRQALGCLNQRTLGRDLRQPELRLKDLGRKHAGGTPSWSMP